MKQRKPIRTWPVYLLTLPAFVAIWSGWVGLGQLAGFGPVNLLPGIGDGLELNTAITLPIGMETYAAFALLVWMSGRAPVRARRYARRTALSSLVVGSLGQIGYHLMAAAGWRAAPWPVVILVSIVPVAVLGMGAGLVHLIRSVDEQDGEQTEQVPEQTEQAELKIDRVALQIDPDPEQVDLITVLERHGIEPWDAPVPALLPATMATDELYELYGEPIEQVEKIVDPGADQVGARRRSDDELWHAYGDALCRAWIEEDGLTRYRVEQWTKASSRQANRLIDRIKRTVDAEPPQEVST